MAQKRRWLVVAALVATSVLATSMLASQPTSAASSVRYSPGNVALGASGQMTLYAYNPTEKIVNATFTLDDASGNYLNGAAPSDEIKVFPHTVEQFIFTCNASGCLSGVPVIVSASKSLVPGGRVQFTTSAVPQAMFANDWKILK